MSIPQRELPGDEPLQANLDVVRDGLVTVRDAALFTGLSRSTIYELMERGELVYAKLGRARRIPRRALLELAANSLRGGWRHE